MNHNELHQKNFKTGDIIALTVTIFKQNINFIGEYINLDNESANIKIGIGDQVCHFPLSNIKTVEYLFRNNESDLNSNNNFYNILGIYKSEISLKRIKNDDVLRCDSKVRSGQQIFISDDISILIKEFELLLISKLIVETFKCNIFNEVKKYANDSYNKGEKEKGIIIDRLGKKFRNDIKIPVEFIEHYKIIVICSGEIINDVKILKSYKDIEKLLYKADETLNGTKKNLFNVLKRLYENLIKVSTYLVNFLLIKLESIKVTSNIVNFKETFLRRIFDVTYLKLRLEKLLELDLFGRLLPNNYINVIENKALNNSKLKYKIRLTYYLLAYAILVQCGNNDFEIFVRYITNKLLKDLRRNTEDIEIDDLYNNSSSCVYIPFVYRPDTDDKRFFIHLMFALNESGFLNVNFDDNNDDFYNSLKNRILSEFVRNEYLSLSEGINNIIYNYLHVYSNSLDYCNKIRVYFVVNDIISVSKWAKELLIILENYGHKFLFVFPKNCDNVLLFLERLIEITKKDNQKFEHKEALLSRSRDYCESLIAIHSDDYFTFYIYNCLSQLNDYTHSNTFSILFYKRFVPVISIILLDDYISFDDKNSILILPITIRAETNRQCPAYRSLLVNTNLSDESVEIDLSQKIFKVNNDLNIIVKIPCRIHNPDLQFSVNMAASSEVVDEFSTLSNKEYTVSIDFKLNYTYKSSFDFENHTIVYTDSTSRFNKSFVLKYHKPFVKIRNEFKNYKNGSVVEDERMFFGRDSTIRETLDFFLNPKGDLIPGRCVCLYGQTRTGKSTISFHLRKKLAQNPNIIVVNFGDIGSITNFEIFFKYNFIYKILDTIVFDHMDLYDYLTSVNFIFSINEESFKDDPNTYFNNFMSSLSSKIYKSKLNKQIIVVLDEFTYVYDWIRNGEISSNFMRFFKSFLQNFNVSALLIGQDHTPQFINDVRFAGYLNSIVTLELNYLSENDSSLLISKPVSKEWCDDESCIFSPDCINFLYSFTAGSPYILMNLCSDFVDYLNDLQTKTASIAHVEDFIDKHLANIQEILFEPLYCDKFNLDSDDAIKRNKKLLTLIAINVTSSGYADIDKLNLSESDRSHLSLLSQRNIVEIHNNSCKIKVRLYSEWLKRLNRSVYESR
jgi:KaiC/GvpD/RAD55 family RecA-like ATPase